MATRAGADVFFLDAAIALGDASKGAASAFGDVLLTKASGAGDDAGAPGDSDSSAGDGVAAGIGSAAATGEATGAGLAFRRAITKPADAIDRVSEATAAAMKRDPEDI